MSSTSDHVVTTPSGRKSTLCRSWCRTGPSGPSGDTVQRAVVVEGFKQENANVQGTLGLTDIKIVQFKT